MEPKVLAAVITGLGVIIAAIVAGVVSWLVAGKTARAQVNTKMEELTQTQLRDILAKRIEVYPTLWSIAQTLLSDWEREHKLSNPDWKPDLDWARNLLQKLIEWHKVNGVFLSEESYRVFAALRNSTLGLVRTCSQERRQPTLEEFQLLDQIYYRGDPNRPPNDPLRYSLATWLKNDLGSYKTPVTRI